MHDELASSGKRAATAGNSITNTINNSITHGSNSITHGNSISHGITNSTATAITTTTATATNYTNGGSSTTLNAHLFEHNHSMPTLGCDHNNCGHVPSPLPGGANVWAMEEMEEYDTEALLAHVHHHF